MKNIEVNLQLFDNNTVIMKTLYISKELFGKGIIVDAGKYKAITQDRFDFRAYSDYYTSLDDNSVWFAGLSEQDVTRPTAFKSREEALKYIQRVKNMVEIINETYKPQLVEEFFF